MDQVDRSEISGVAGEALKPMDAAVRRALVESHLDLLRFLQRRLGSQEEAEELLQRFMLKAIERAGDLKNVQTVRGWLGRVLATTIVDYQRSAIRRRRHEQAVDPQELEIAADLAIEPDVEVDQAICDCLYHLLPTLKPEYAEVIWRADLLGEPRDRLAVSLGTTVNNITVRLHRARLALKVRLEQMCRTCVVHGFLDCRCEKSDVVKAAMGGGQSRPEKRRIKARPAEGRSRRD